MPILFRNESESIKHKQLQQITSYIPIITTAIAVNTCEDHLKLSANIQFILECDSIKC